MPRQPKKILLAKIREKLSRPRIGKNQNFKSIKQQKKTKNFKRRRNLLVRTPVKEKVGQEERLWLLSLEQYGPRALLAAALTNIKKRVHENCPKSCRMCKYRKRSYAITDAKIEYLKELMGLNKKGEEQELVTKENIFFEELGQITKRTK